MGYTTLLVEDREGVRTITLNRPERRNAMTPEMQLELIDVMADAADSNKVRVLVFAGAGEAFCAGLDLGSLQAMNSRSEIDSKADAERIAHLFRSLYEMPKPTIALVQGAAIAGGTGLATMCDFTFAAPGAKFGYTEVRIGFVPAIVSAFLILQVGERRARDLLLTGRIFTSDEALRLGLVNEIVAVEELEPKKEALISMLRGNSPEAMAATKRLLAAQNKAWLDAAMEVSLGVNAEARNTHDFREGVAAFLEKRKPLWGGGESGR